MNWWRKWQRQLKVVARCVSISKLASSSSETALFNFNRVKRSTPSMVVLPTATTLPLRARPLKRFLTNILLLHRQWLSHLTADPQLRRKIITLVILTRNNWITASSLFVILAITSHTRRPKSASQWICLSLARE